MKKIVIITAQGFQDEEVIYPYYRLKEEGFDVEVATPTGNIVYGKYGVPARATMSCLELKAENFDAVVIPGGFEAPDRVRLIPEVLQFLKDLNSSNKLIAAICHGPWVMISAQITENRKMTGYWSIEADLKNSGAKYEHKVPVVIDGNFITSPHYENNGDFMKAVITYLKEY